MQQSEERHVRTVHSGFESFDEAKQWAEETYVLEFFGMKGVQLIIEEPVEGQGWNVILSGHTGS